MTGKQWRALYEDEYHALCRKKRLGQATEAELARLSYIMGELGEGPDDPGRAWAEQTRELLAELRADVEALRDS